MTQHRVDAEPVGWTFRIPQPETSLTILRHIFENPTYLTFKNYNKANEQYGAMPVAIIFNGKELLASTGIDPKIWEIPTPNSKSRLRRYMSYAQFRSVLDTHSLFFATVGKLRDDWEGFIAWPESEESQKATESEWDLYRMLSSFLKRCMVSCWQAYPHESNLMWNTYAAKEGIAIETTFGRLQRSIENACDQPIEFGAVSYVSPSERMNIPNLSIAPLFHKRIEYRAEEEVRAVLPGPQYLYRKDDGENFVSPFESDDDLPDGRLIAVDLNTLIEAVVLPPKAPHWFGQLVREDIRVADISAEVRPSTLDEYLPGSAN